MAHLLDPPFDALWIGEELPERKDSNTAGQRGQLRRKFVSWKGLTNQRCVSGTLHDGYAIKIQ
jgi:hypothetical protein